MSFGTATARFSLQAARHRVDNFGGTAAAKTADADGYNFQLVATGEKIRGVFSRLSTAMDVRLHGRTFRVTAKLIVRRSLNLVLDENTVFMHLVTKEKFVLVQIGVDHTMTAELPLLLRREEE